MLKQRADDGSCKSLNAGCGFRLIQMVRMFDQLQTHLGKPIKTSSFFNESPMK